MLLKERIDAIRSQTNYQKIGWILSACFPVCLVLFTELNQSGSFLTLGKLIFHTPSIFLFDILFTSFLFWFFSLLFRRTFISGIITGVLYFALSCVEFYRFENSGQHFTLADISTVGYISNVTQFATLRLYWFMFAIFFLLAAYVALLWILGTKISWKWSKRLPVSGIMLVLGIVFFLFPAVSKPVFSLFSVNHTSSSNNFVLNEKFDDNQMIAFLVENATDLIDTVRIQEPDNYSEESVDSTEVEANTTVSQKPNVITVMSESYTDFREFPKLGISNDYYKNFDKFSQEGFSQKAVVPTFGGYTVKSEFELLFGLPIKSLKGRSDPQSVIQENVMQTTIARQYKEAGYSTCYIHPYIGEFYDRSKLLPYYGFDKIYFEDSLKMDGNLFHGYADDRVTYDQAVRQIEEEENPVYIHITTMQNHMPYDKEEGQLQINYYLDGIANTDKRLGELYEALKNLDEPTILLFVGDHFPLFTDENNVYEQLGINGKTSLEVYKQPYFIWSNYDLDTSSAPKELVSLFYLPYVVMDLAGLPDNEVSATVKAQMESTPIYSMEYTPDLKNTALDLLTYDLILGDQYAAH
jgi:phosphoglycerol transferase MdoB-like AlkP superfamily enzyme